jgi:hypothetical protein
MNLTVACVFVTGHVPFTASYVMRLKSMAARNLPEHRFVCLTNREDELPPDIETIPVDPPRNAFAWWTKLQLFKDDIGLSGRVLYLDLDTLLVGSLLPIVEYPAELALVPDGAPHFKPKGRWQCVKKFNSSVIVFDAGGHHYLWDDWNFFVTNRLWGDQDWIGSAMPLEWFPRLSEVSNGKWSEEAKVVLCKKPKNSVAALTYPWFKEAWQ